MYNLHLVTVRKGRCFAYLQDAFTVPHLDIRRVLAQPIKHVPGADSLVLQFTTPASLHSSLQAPLRAELPASEPACGC